MAEQEEILQLRRLARSEYRSEELKKIIDTLASYGEPTISAILQIVADDYRSEVIDYGLSKVIEIKGRK